MKLTIITNVKLYLKYINKVKLKIIILLFFYFYYNLYYIVTLNAYQNKYLNNISEILLNWTTSDIIKIQLFIIFVLIFSIAIFIYYFNRLLCIFYVTFIAKYLYYNINNKSMDTFKCFAFEKFSLPADNNNNTNWLDTIDWNLIIKIGLIVTSVLVICLSIYIYINQNGKNDGATINTNNKELQDLRFNNLEDQVNKLNQFNKDTSDKIDLLEVNNVDAVKVLDKKIDIYFNDANRVFDAQQRLNLKGSTALNSLENNSKKDVLFKNHIENQLKNVKESQELMFSQIEHINTSNINSMKRIKDTQELMFNEINNINTKFNNVTNKSNNLESSVESLNKNFTFNLNKHFNEINELKEELSELNKNINIINQTDVSDLKTVSADMTNKVGGIGVDVENLKAITLATNKIVLSGDVPTSVLEMAIDVLTSDSLPTIDTTTIRNSVIENVNFNQTLNISSGKELKALTYKND